MLAVYLLIPLLYKLRFGQNVYELAPESHQKKQGIPTMGGIAFIAVSTLVAFISLGFDREHVFLILGMLLFAIIGFVDDSMKLFFGRNLGLKARQKLILQILMGSLMAYLLKGSASTLLIPLTNRYIHLGVLYYPFVIVFYLAMTNSTNLTDGIDGLLASVSLLTVVCAGCGGRILQTDLYRPTLIFAASFGVSLFQSLPGKTDDGGYGEHGNGGFIACASGDARRCALLIGVVYVAESLSLILQSLAQRRGERILR